MNEKRRHNSDGIYHYCITEQTIVETAHTSLQGFFWLANFAASVKRIRIREIFITFSLAGASTMATRPRVTFQRITHTGDTHSGGTAFTPIKRDSRDPTAVGSLRSSSTGLTALATVSANAPFAQFYSPVITQVTGAGIVILPSVGSLWNPNDEHEEILLLPGEGIVCQQPDAGTTTDQRRFICSITTEEFRI